MIQRILTSLVLLTVFGGGVSAGIPMHTQMNEAMMDCCKKAMDHNLTKMTAEARLCCAVNCQEPATPGTNVNTSSSSGTVLLPVPLVIRPIGTHPTSRFLARFSDPALYSNPTYIRNLALLI